MEKGESMTKNDLNEYFWLNHEIKQQKSRLKRMEEKLQHSGEVVGDSVQKYYNGKAHPYKIEGIAETDIQLPLMIVTLKEEIEANIDKAEKKAVEIERFIQGVEQAKTREILRSRFIDCLDWEHVGTANYIAPDYARRVVREFFFEQKKKSV